MSATMGLAQAGGLLGEPPPRKLTRRLWRRVGRTPSRRTLNVTTTLAHLGFGAGAGVLYALLPPAVRSAPRGALFGLGIWATSYAGWIPALGLMKRPKRDRPGRPTSMVLSHLVYGAVLGALTARTATPDRFAGQVVVVCGGSRGLGLALAKCLARGRARVAICARSPEELTRARDELAAFDVPVLAAVCDLTNEVATRAFMELVRHELGPIDLLVANAATITVAPLETLTPTDLESAMTSTFGTAANAALAVLPSMRSRGRGTVAFIASVGGVVGIPHLSGYSAAKFATVGFAEAVRAEVAKDGVRIVTAFPGLMRTGSHLHARFRGKTDQEFAWFGAGALAPILSIDADRAARRIVAAIARGDETVAFTPETHLALRTRGLFPGLWSLAMKIAARALPPAPSRSETLVEEDGTSVVERSFSPVVEAIQKRTAPLAARHGQ